MRPAVIRAYTLGVLTGSFLTAGVVLLATPAKAEPIGDAVVAYAAVFGDALCAALDYRPTTDTISHIGEVIVGDGLSWEQAGQVVWLSVSEICPRHTALMNSYPAVA